MASEIEKLRTAHALAVKLVMVDPEYLPIFERIESELTQAEAATLTDPVSKARALAAARRQMAMS
jgi:hypothetical protein